MPVFGLSISFTFELNDAGTRRRYGTLHTVARVNRGGLQIDYRWTRYGGLTPEQITYFHEKLAAIINKTVAADQCRAVWNTCRRTRQLLAEPGNKVFEVAVVAYVNCRSRMGQVSDEKVEIQVPCRGQ